MNSNFYVKFTVQEDVAPFLEPSTDEFSLVTGDVVEITTSLDVIKRDEFRVRVREDRVVIYCYYLLLEINGVAMLDWREQT